MFAKLVTWIFTSTIRSQKFNLLVTLILYLTLKFLKLLESFGLMFHEIDIPISTQVICEGKNITITTTRCYTHGPQTSVCMISNKSVARSIIPENGVLVILPIRHASHLSSDSKSSDSRSPSEWSFFMRFTSM